MAELVLTELESVYVALAERDAQAFLKDRIAILLKNRGLDPLKGPYKLEAKEGGIVLHVPDEPAS